MPADETYDTPHAVTVKVGHTEYCWNNRSPMANGYWAQDGVRLSFNTIEGEKFISGSHPVYRFIKNRMSQPCGQRKGMAPIGCDGCEELQK